MIRWLRFVLVVAALLVLVAIGVTVTLLVLANDRYVSVVPHPLLAPYFETWLRGEVVEIHPLAGWLVASVTTALLVCGTLLAVWRRRQYESWIRRLERELVKLRNLPMSAPAPLEDLPESPDAATASLLTSATRGPLSASALSPRIDAGGRLIAGGDARSGRAGAEEHA
ncbi:hypothetical protein [Haliangium ochraceum]|uniref:LapA family protein n=1 Tax=Haliangium ochraceum (strain DSM 14365 / JCM 11303 / SMP-2) TaxID=502025 RepID=D0LJ73_HALO1|nr:hypothetical protein [Haliangium ochraceum]ACY14920.1 hypothetical protein Hoch_2383 [Haliangium ochraceum DSM 14365]